MYAGTISTQNTSSLPSEKIKLWNVFMEKFLRRIFCDFDNLILFFHIGIVTQSKDHANLHHAHKKYRISRS